MLNPSKCEPVALNLIVVFTAIPSLLPPWQTTKLWVSHEQSRGNFEEKRRLKMENMDCALSLIFNILEHLVRMGKSEFIGG